MTRNVVGRQRILNGIDVGGLAVCRECTSLRGDVVLRTGTAAVQRCACPDHDDPCWRGYDFNKAAELCSCCCREVIPSGSRWSSYHCDDCRRRVIALNRTVGRCVVPIGRHSLMNGVFLDPSPRTDESATRFARDFRNVVVCSDRLREWKTMSVRRVLAAIPGDGPVPLDVYLPAARRVMRSKVAAYRDLLGSWTDELCGAESSIVQ